MAPHVHLPGLKTSLAGGAAAIQRHHGPLKRVSKVMEFDWLSGEGSAESHHPSADKPFLEAMRPKLLVCRQPNGKRGA
jgi:hypothetical protein